jgi:hypothetical protein
MSMRNAVRIHGLALALLLFSAATTLGQTPSPAPASRGPLASITDIAPCGPPACTPYEDRNGPLLIGSPLLDSAPGTPGWVAALDVGLVVPHIKNRLTAPVTLASGATDTVHLPTADLGLRGMPKIELGYRFGQAAGELTLSYRVLVADGSQIVGPAELPPFAPTGAGLRSRLDLQVIDLEYGSYEPRTVCGVDMKWRVGVRTLIAFNDSQAANGFLAQQTVNHYWGVGPVASVDFRHAVGHTGLALFGRLESSVPIGRLTQQFSETMATDTGESHFFSNEPILTFAVQAGLTWTPRWCDRLHVSAGYLYEHFWDLGSMGVSPGASREELSIQGGFLRAEWNY